ncbi:MAG: 5-deoxy-glucuronate isomerase [bacterium]|nr:5-deoxy-glucuronate isomerase [bacterium]
MNNPEWLIKKTGQHRGRKLIITPQNSDLKFLSYGRIILNQDNLQMTLRADNREIALICLQGNGEISFNGCKEAIIPYDAVYIPLGGEVVIATQSELDLVECSAPATFQTQYAVVKFAEIKTNKTLYLAAGKEPYRRDIYTLIGENVSASRLLVGVTFSQPGNWTSWPPHEHTDTREEIYLYFNMPEPAYGVQFVYTDSHNMEFVGIVHENDAVVIPKGYHPNVSVPGYSINFVWMMAGLREQIDRQWAAVNNEPGFDGRY